ncbi:MAG: hypothetical protein WBW33_03725 [Bryobacteraceae bacterium]
MKTLSAIAIVLGLIAPALNASNKNSAPGIQQTTDTINSCVKNSNSFKKTFDKALAQPNVRAGKQNEENLNQSAANLASQMDKVGDSWNKDHNMNETRAHVSNAIVQASNVNRAMTIWHMGSDCESQWAVLRNQLNQLARTFNVPGVR